MFDSRADVRRSYARQSLYIKTASILTTVSRDTVAVAGL
jgi:hypothetical protein